MTDCWRPVSTDDFWFLQKCDQLGFDRTAADFPKMRARCLGELAWLGSAPGRVFITAVLVDIALRRVALEPAKADA